MKKVLSLFLVVVLVLSFGTMAGAVGAQEYLGNMSFNRADGFDKFQQTDISCGFQHTKYPSQTIAVTYLKGYLEGLNAKNIAGVDESLLKNMLDEACSAANFSQQMTKRNGFTVTVTLGEKYAGMKQNNAGIPIYLYEVNYTGRASGREPFYGHFAVAVFGHFDDMYMFEFDRALGESSTNVDFMNMLNTVNFTNESSGGVPGTQVSSNPNAIKIKIDGSYVYPDSDPLIKNDRTIVPIRAVAEKLGYEVSWDGDTRTVTIVSGLDTLKIKIGQKYMDLYTAVPGKNYSERARLTLDAPAEIINDRTYLPLRAIGEALGCDVDWDGANRTVLIES